MLQASSICYNPEGWCKKWQDPTATAVSCEKNAVHELTLVGSQILAPKELWLVVLHLLHKVHGVSMSANRVLTGDLFWQLIRRSED